MNNAIGLAGYIHLLLFCVLLPLGAIRSARKLASRPFPPRAKFLISVIIQHLVFTGFSLLIARAEWIELFAPPKDPYRASLLGMLMLMVLLAVMFPLWKNSVIKRERKLYLFMPRNLKEKSLWIAVSALAGFGEEVIYRGVMFALFWRLTGSAFVAVFFSAAFFAYAHIVQGLKSVGLIFLIAVAFHALVLATGSLFVAMIVHFIYDVTAGFTYSHLGEKFGYPAEEIPPPHASGSIGLS